MTSWELLDFVTPDLRNPYQEWYGNQDPSVQAAIDDTVAALLKYDDWTERDGQEFRQFTEEDAGLSSIRVTVLGQFKPKKHRAERRRVRVLGLYRPDQDPPQFIFLGGFEKWMGGLLRKPSDAIKQAQSRRQQFEENRGSTREHI